MTNSDTEKQTHPFSGGIYMHMYMYMYNYNTCMCVCVELTDQYENGSSNNGEPHNDWSKTPHQQNIEE